MIIEAFADYRTLILQRYQQKKVAGNLSPRLARPTPAGVKDECLAVCAERYNRRDSEILRVFFGQSGDVKISLQAIKKCERDKFKPLVNFLIGKTVNPDDKIVELLAWLIDFQPRPHEFRQEYEPVVTDEPGLSREPSPAGEAQKKLSVHELQTGPEEENQQNTPSKPGYGKPFSMVKIITVIASIGILVSTAGWIYWSKHSSLQGNYLAGQKCMYWTGDHYEPISCHPRPDTTVIALDSVKLRYFKKITSPDTITLNAIGKVWYSKKNNELEYFTSNGDHPVDNQIRLKPITAYIIRKHILRL